MPASSDKVGRHLFRLCHVPNIHRSEKEMESSECARDRFLTRGYRANVYSSSYLPIDFPNMLSCPSGPVGPLRLETANLLRRARELKSSAGTCL
jgi:hypothetical protein